MSDTLNASAATADTDRESDLPERPFWLSVLRWLVWWLMLVSVIAFVSRHGGGAFIYQNY